MYYPPAKFRDTSSGFCFRVLTYTSAALQQGYATDDDGDGDDDDNCN